jgi:hypothetical protein
VLVVVRIQVSGLEGLGVVGFVETKITGKAITDPGLLQGRS